MSLVAFTEEDPAVVTSEDDAWDLIEGIKDGRHTFESFRAVKFDGWPIIRAYIPEERLHGALTPYMMEGFVDLQRSIYRSHALLVHDSANARLLSDAEKSSLELVVEVREGSSDNSIDFTQIAIQIGTAMVEKVEPIHIVATILGLGVLYAGTTAWKAYLEKAKETKIAEIQSKAITDSLAALQFTQQTDLERMKVFADAMVQTPKLAQIKEDADEVRQSITRHLTKDSDATINGVEIPQEAGQRLTRNSRTNSTDVRLDGVYRINRVDTTSPEGFRVRLQNIEDGTAFDAGVQDDVLSSRQMETLREAEWKKVPVTAQINAKRKGDEIFEATVIEVDPYKAEE